MRTSETSETSEGESGTGVSDLHAWHSERGRCLCMRALATLTFVPPPSTPTKSSPVLIGCAMSFLRAWSRLPV